jgi:O-antigen ligase
MREETIAVASSSALRIHSLSVAFILLASVCAGVAVCILSPSRIAAGVALVALSLILLRRPEAGIILLVLTSLFSGIKFELPPVTIRPDQIIALLLTIVFVFLVRQKRLSLGISSLTLLIVLYLALNLISSLMHSLDLRMSLQRCLLLGITFSAYFLTERLITSKEFFYRLLKILLVAAFLEALFGTVSVILLPLGIETGGAYFAGTDQLYARGTMLEGNVFGCFMMMMGLVLQSMILSPAFRHRRGWLILILSALVTGAILSFTRAAWLSWVVGTLFYLFTLRKGRVKSLIVSSKWVLLALVLTLVFVLILSTQIKVHDVYLIDLYKDRASRIFEHKSGTGLQRVVEWSEALRLWRESPWFGNGTDSVKILGVGTKIALSPGGYWISNSLILALHDTGIVGFVAFSAIQIYLFTRMWSAAKATHSVRDRAVLQGFLTAFLGVQIACVFTNAFWLIFVWAFMGIGHAAARLATSAVPAPAE